MTQQYSKEELQEALYIYLINSGGSYPERLLREFEVERVHLLWALEKLVLSGKITYDMKNSLKWFAPK